MTRKPNPAGFHLDTRAGLPHKNDHKVSNGTVSNASTDRPWPPPSPDTGWWRAETAGQLVPDAAREFVTAPPDDTPTVVVEAGKDLVPFPLWPAPADPSPAAPADVAVEPVHRGRHTEEARIEEWPPALLRLGRSAASTTKNAKKSSRRARQLRQPAGGLSALLILALVSGFFAWTTAEPLWLAAGRGEVGTATITRCQGKSVLRRCVATFRSPAFTAERVSVLGSKQGVGVEVSARMVGRTGRIAYAGGDDGLHARWSVGLGLLLLCGAAIAWLTGALRLPTRRSRTWAVTLSFTLPLTLLLGMLIAVVV
jgi:hypothetical protein